MDDQIRDLYLNEVGIKAVAYSGPVRDLAAKFNMPGWRVSKRGNELGILPMRKKEPDWCEKELEILERNAHLTPRIVKKHLRRAGFPRTEQGISIQRKRLHISRNSMDGYTGRSLAECFGVELHTVTRWIAKGWLKARRRGTARTPQQGGDEWYITDTEVKKFIMGYVEVIDFRKIDKIWCVSLLTGEYI